MTIVDVVDLEPSGVDVAQHHVGRAIAIEVAEARDLPLQSHLTDLAGSSDTVVVDVEDGKLVTRVMALVGG